MSLILFIIYGLVSWCVVAKTKIKISQALLPLIAFTIISSVALNQNYTMSLIPEVTMA